MSLLSIIREKHRLSSYKESIQIMEDMVKQVIEGKSEEKIWILEYEDVYTAGYMSRKSDILANIENLEYTNRGGKLTYHGPGQRIIYTILNLHRMDIDIRSFVSLLEKWIINTLSSFKLKTYSIPKERGIWINTNNVEKKIASIGLKVRKGIVYHGIAVNLKTKLEMFNHIIPCGIESCIMTSLKEEGINVSIEKFDKVLINNIPKEFTNT